MNHMQYLTKENDEKRKNKMSENKIETEKKIGMGQIVQDIVTGFQGTVTGVCSYITGCDQVSIISKAGKDGSTKNSWADINRVKWISDPTPEVQALIDGKMADGSDAVKLGGPQDSPPAK